MNYTEIHVLRTAFQIFLCFLISIHIDSILHITYHYIETLLLHIPSQDKPVTQKLI
jgi:hypothetical protein